MRLAISNIAWDVGEDETIAALLTRFDVDAIDIAPGKYFPDPPAATENDIKGVREWWAERGFEITGMQALLFGTTGLNLFGAPDVQNAMLNHLQSVCRIGAGLGARRLVFGSPKNRDRTGLNDQETLDIAVPFFRRLGGLAQTYDVTICLEPNPVCYGTNFMTTSADTAEVVRLIDHPAIRMQLDSGAIAINGEEPEAVLEGCRALIGHIHASEPNLLPLGDGGAEHAKVMTALLKHLPEQVVTIEMLATSNEPHVVSIARALAVADRFYRNSGQELTL
ncbi:MAG: sugar phosphate isomerase/epimerase [Methylococcaceae bacterium]|nr:sugar phosphate isomerase/epimerase [Methylococcaceae bacterium]